MTPKSERYYRRKVDSKWQVWRLVVEGVISYSEANNMTLDEVREANAALDKYIEQKNNQSP